MAANGNDYKLMMDSEGMWSAMYVEFMVNVTLGTQGSAPLTRAENGSWSYLGETVTTGSSVNTANGNEYTLMYVDGAWSAEFVPVSMMIEGTGLTAMTREGDDMYDVGDDTLAASGVGDVTVDGGMYHVWMVDGGLAGARFDKAIDPQTDFKVGDVEKLPTLSAEDKDTAATELRTQLTIVGEKFSMGDLLGSGSATVMGDGIVAKALKEMEDIRTDVEALLGVFDAGDATLRTQLGIYWNDKAQGQVNKVFGAGTVDLGRTPDEDDIVDEIGDLIAALSSESAFAAATEKDGKGVFAAAQLDAAAAADAFAAVASEASVRFGVTGDTRYGAVYKQERDIATEKLAYRYFLPKVLVDPDDSDAPITAITLGSDAGVSLTQTSGETVAKGSDYDDNHIKVGDFDDVKDAIASAVASSVDSSALGSNQKFTVAVTDGSTAGTYTVTFTVTTTDTDGTTSDQTGTTLVKLSPEVYTPPDASTGDGEVGAFAWGTINETVRTRHIQSTGNAYYEGGTRAVSGKGVHYSGDIALRVRFATNKVSGLITNLADDDGLPWEYYFGDADSIILPTATLKSNTQWTEDSDEKAQVTFASRAGSPRPRDAEATFRGILLGRNDDAGSQAVGTWSVGTDTRAGSRYLAGAFGAVQTSDEPDVRPGTDQGGGVDAMISSSSSAKLEGGKLKLTVNRYGWNYGHTGANDQDTPAVSDDVLVPATSNDKWNYGLKMETVSDDNRKIKDQNGTAAGYPVKFLERTHEVGLEALFAKDGAELNTNGSKHVDDARTELETLRSRLSVLIDTDQLPASQTAIWQDVQDILETRLFGKVPEKLSDAYDKDEAVALIDRVLDALQSQDELEAALEKDGGGIFTDDGDPVSSRAVGDIWGERETQVKARLGSTNFTRFGVWRVRNTKNALRSGGWQDRTAADKDGPGVFAYSPLPAAVITLTTDPSYPGGSTATYTGGTRAIQGKAMYEGEVLLTATWSATTVSASLSMEISNLRNAANGDPLAYSLYENADGTFSATASTSALGKLIFAGDITATPDSGDGEKLKFSSVGDSDATSSLAVRVGATDPGVQQESLAFATDPTSPGDLDTAMVDGMFVGSGQDGPLGVIGQWSVSAKGVNVSGDGTISAINDGSNIKIGDGTLLQGAFGAELP